MLKTGDKAPLFTLKDEKGGYDARFVPPTSLSECH